MKTKMFLGVLLVGSFCVAVPAQAQSTPSGNAAETKGATGKTSGKAQQQGAATTGKSAGKSGNGDAKAKGPEQKRDLNMGGSGLSPSKIEVSSGRVVLNVRNSSDKPHKMVLEGGTIKKVSVDMNINANATIDGDLPPGAYTLRCQTGGHHESSTKVTVK
jgi:hypothetical protein